jgi:pimeloyl-ACP methyl ester carboxylesterase
MRILLLLCVAQIGLAQPSNTVRRLPPPGISVPSSVRTALEEQHRKLQAQLAAAEANVKSDRDALLLPDVQIYEKAVRYALRNNEFFRTNEFGIATNLIEQGLRRIREIEKRSASWLTATGLVVRGYQSRIDGSVQPYGLVVPSSYSPQSGKRYRLDIWLHGRDETLTELKFIHERSTRAGEFTPADTFVLHPYGRYCNAFKFAGETDVLESLEAVERSYPIDRSRIALRGFSMGGAGAWHLATHFADRWACAAPGAGFAETAQYMRLNSATIPTYERKLWQWYDATDYAANLFHCPVVAYSGELDKQRQAAEVMSRAMAQEGLPLIHLIGPNTEHKYEPQTKLLLNTIVDTFAIAGRPQTPKEIHFTTRTLRYSKMHWLTLLKLERQWERADVWARLEDGRISIWATNVAALALDFRVDHSQKVHAVEVNGSKSMLPQPQATNLLIVSKVNGNWTIGSTPGPTGKRPGLQGPIDDAFTGSFVFVTPTERPFHAETGTWMEKELNRAISEWRAQFRGDARVVKDVDLNASHIQNCNLVLWGDPQSNLVLRKIIGQLPLKWSAETIQFAQRTLISESHVPLLIYPNPLNPEKYIVLNSGFTFRGFGSNASQTPKLPDFALLDIREPDPFESGIAAAGFFNEEWRIDAE